MVIQWLTPILSWLGIGLVPFLLLVLIIILVFRG